MHFIKMRPDIHLQSILPVYRFSYDLSIDNRIACEKFKPPGRGKRITNTKLRSVAMSLNDAIY